MTLIRHKLAAATAVAAAISLVATPAAAVDLPRLSESPQAAKAAALEAENRRHRGHHDDDWDIDGDDVLAGVLILGGIAAIAGIANAGKNREQSYPEPAPWPEDAGYQAPPRDDYRNGGMAQAVDTCVAEIEQGGDRIASVDAVSREADGWRVSGALDEGMSYWCTIDGAGQVSGVGGSGTAYAEPVADGQYDDAFYVRARAAKAQVEVDGDLGGDAAGYAVAQAGD